MLSTLQRGAIREKETNDVVTWYNNKPEWMQAEYREKNTSEINESVRPGLAT